MTFSLLAAAYLFFGGVGAGTFCFSAIGDLLRHYVKVSTTVVTRGFGVAIAFLAAGVLCLILDLGRPDQAILVFLNPTLSYLSVGAFLLASLMLIALALVLARSLTRLEGRSVIAILIESLGIAIALGVMVYTGLLLRELRPVPLWSTPLLPVLFLLSSLAAGLDCFYLCASPIDELITPVRRQASQFTVLNLFLVIMEALAAFLAVASIATGIGAEIVPANGVVATATSSVAALFGNSKGSIFVGGFVVLAIVIPIINDIAALRRASSPEIATIAAIASIAGCFCLRAGIVLAGIHIGV